MRTITTVIICLGVHTPIVQAEFQTIGAGIGWLIGGAIEFEKTPYQQADTSLQPYIAYEWENLHIGVDDISYNFFSVSTLSLTVGLQPRWTPIDEDDSTFIGLDRDSGIEAGLTVDYIITQDLVSQWHWQNTFFTDISGVHKGYFLTSKLGFQREYARYTLDISTGIRHQSAQLNQYLYGINADETNSNRSEFSANSSVHPFVEFNLQYQLTERSFLISQVSFDMLTHDIKQSPLVKNPIPFGTLIGWVRVF